MAGVPIIIPTNKESFKQWLKLVGIVLIVLAIYFTAVKVQFKQPDLIVDNAVPFSEMNKTDVYEMQDIVVFDRYAEYTDHSYVNEFFSVLIKDSDGYSKYASLLINVDNGDIYNQMVDFSNDLTLGYGDCVVNGCFTAERLDDYKTNDESLENLFNNDLSAVQQVLNAQSTDLVLRFVCTSENFGEYKNGIKSENMKWIFISAALAVGGFLLIAVGIFMSRKDKKKSNENAAKAGGFSAFENIDNTQSEFIAMANLPAAEQFSSDSEDDKELSN